jgi:hypothetical protein
MTEMRLLMEYFAQFDGAKEWKVVEPFADSLYHPEMVATTAKGEMDKESFKKNVQAYVEGGGSIEMLKLEKVPNGIRYELIFHKPDGTAEQTATMGVFKDGKLYRVTPDDPAVYSSVLQDK